MAEQHQTESGAVQFALQIQVNSGSPSAYWHFDDDFEVRDHVALAWDDMDEAEDMGYRPTDLRVVAITVLPEPSNPPAPSSPEEGA